LSVKSLGGELLHWRTKFYDQETTKALKQQMTMMLTL